MAYLNFLVFTTFNSSDIDIRKIANVLEVNCLSSTLLDLLFFIPGNLFENHCPTLDTWEDRGSEGNSRKSSHLWTSSGLSAISESTENLHLIEVNIDNI